MSAARAAFFRRDGDGFAPTGLGLNPWNGRSQSGVSLAALVAHVLEGTPSRTPMLTTRVTIDILGAVPMTRLVPVVRVLRDGPRVQLVEAMLEAEGRSWVRATALRARMADSPTVTQPLTHDFPADVGIARPLTPWFETIRVKGRFSEASGAGALWSRLTADAVAGVALTPLQRLAVLADFGAGAAPVVSFEDWTSANLDIALHQSRTARGEWLLIDSRSESAGNGLGVSVARIGDADGMFATTLQTVFLDPRGGAAETA